MFRKTLGGKLSVVFTWRADDYMLDQKEFAEWKKNKPTQSGDVASVNFW